TLIANQNRPAGGVNAAASSSGANASATAAFDEGTGGALTGQGDDQPEETAFGFPVVRFNGNNGPE
ncbi:hypothetical protein LTS18_012064, partial [Coniosporium uncinatum]